jgi:hypothetical protein
VTAGQIGTYIDDTPTAAEIVDDIVTGAAEMHAAVGEVYF